MVIGSGRLGADVGGVITLGAGGRRLRCLASLGGAEPASNRHRLPVPVAAVLALIGLDLVTGGGAHLTRVVSHGGGSGGLLDVVKRRSVISWRGLRDTTVLVICILGAIAFSYAIWRRKQVVARSRARRRSRPAYGVAWRRRSWARSAMTRGR